VVLNLVQNALQTADLGANVRLVTSIRNGLAGLEVCDQGQSIHDDEREKVLLPFFPTKRKAPVWA
jgi:signal transduction histidine kinase